MVLKERPVKWSDAFLMEMYARKALLGPYLPISQQLFSPITGKLTRIKYKLILYFDYIFW
jgi:hypothetical protein